MTFPKTAKCEKCEGLAVVIAWVPQEKPTIRPDDDVDKAGSVICRIECPKCGIRVQIIPYSFTS